MAYDEGLAERIDDVLRNNTSFIQSKKMFGGLCYLLNGNMCFGIVDEKLMIRIGVDNHDKYSKFEHVSPMDFTGKKMRGMLYVLPDGIESDHDLEFWVKTCVSFANSLPPKEK
ncbi:MAG: TfoX/Sxy family protein [Candidatus Marinimicrobia bacterium]|nr:TfoX/Sxy family protein [Candidatus Neomarinimicrobiota bacterium]